jgi:hypothetical protein
MNNGTDSIQFKVHGYGKLLQYKDLMKIPPRCKQGLIRVIDLRCQHNYFMRYETIVRKFR